jgi:LysR family transcriptional regulator, regulator for bpeEF and oprC
VVAIERMDELEVFVTTANSGSLSAAASRLRVPINSVSRKLARLEERIGVVLINRTTRSLKLTAEGERILRRAELVLNELKAMEIELQDDKEPRGTLRLAVPTLMTQFGLLDELLRAQRTYSELNIELLVQDEPIPLISVGCDAAIVVGRPADSTNKLFRLGEITPSLAATTSYLEYAGTPTCLDDLADHECLCFVGLGGEPQTHWPLMAPDSKVKMTKMGRGFSSNSSRVLFDALLRGAGIGLVTENEIRRRNMASLDSLQRVLPGYHHIPFELYALLPPEHGESPRSKLALTLFKQGIELTK